MDTAQARALATLRDPDQMRALVQAWWPPAERPGVVVESCSVDFVREAASRTLLQYTIRVVDPNSDARNEHVVSAVAYPSAQAAAVRQRLRASERSTASPASIAELPPWIFDPNLDTLFQIFPFDHRLPALATLLDGPPPVLVPKILAAYGDDGSEMTAWHAETVRYRVDMRAVLRLQVQVRQPKSGQVAARQLYAKLYRESDEGEDAFALQRALWSHTAAGDAAFTVARPLTYVREMRTVLLDDVPGTRLLDLLRNADEALPAIRRTARAVAALHQVPLDQLPTTRGRTANDDAARLSRVVAKLQSALPESAAQVQDIAEAIAADLPNGPAVPTHGDLKPGHLLITEGSVGILDFDKLAVADPLIDVTNLVAAFGKARDSSRRRAEKELALRHTFVEEYFAQVPAAWSARFPDRYAFALLMEAVTTGRGLRGRAERASRAKQMTTLVEQAHAAVTKRAW
jgi:thiamine kinase-like enzyme